MHLARRGWDIAITYQSSAESMSTLAEAIEGMGRRFVPVCADFTLPQAAVDAVAAAVTRQFDRLDLLLHNASHYTPNTLATITLDDIRRDLAIHVETPLLLTQLLRPLLEAAGGTVLCMTDSDLDRTRPSYLSYQISKAALANLTRQLSRELAPKVTVNAIAPGAILWAKGTAEAEKERYLARVPLGRAAEAGDVPELVEFLATRGKYITGETIRMDGGRSLR